MKASQSENCITMVLILKNWSSDFVQCTHFEEVISTDFDHFVQCTDSKTRVLYN